MTAKTFYKSQIAMAIGAIAAVTLSFGAEAAVGLYNTGVDNSNNVLTLGATDTHYTLSGSSETFAVNDAEGYIGYWLQPNTTSRWITPLVGPEFTGSGLAAAGNYVYQTTFDLTGINLATAFINGGVTADNSIHDILINGHSTGSQFYGYGGFQSFVITTGFKSGINTLTFDVVNEGGPTGLRTDFSGSNFVAAPVPEPETYAMLLAGLACIALIARRRKTTGV